MHSINGTNGIHPHSTADAAAGRPKPTKRRGAKGALVETHRKAATRIQSLARRKLAVKEVKELKAANTAAATRIQTLARRKLAVKALRTANTAAATRIQTLARRKLAVKALRTAKALRTECTAASRIQTFARRQLVVKAANKAAAESASANQRTISLIAALTLTIFVIANRKKLSKKGFMLNFLNRNPVIKA